jgi:hypothetical protein
MRILPLALLGLAACSAPDVNDAFTTLELFVEDSSEGANAHVIALLDAAERSAHISLPAGEDTELTDAIIAAWNRGIEVEVTTDYDRVEIPESQLDTRQPDQGILELIDAGVPVQLADAAVSYFDFSLKNDVSWSSDQIIMSDAMAIIDGRHIVNASHLGDTLEGHRVIFNVVSEDIGEDLDMEHNQLFGGADATSLTAYSNMQKSIADNRWLYRTQSSLDLEIWLGPQERLTKRIIDAVYGAHSSIRVLTNDFANEGLTQALEAKGSYGFQIEVVYGPGFGGSNSALSRVFENDTPNVFKWEVSAYQRIPTIILVDEDEARDGKIYPTRAFVLSHDLYSAARLYKDQEVISDQLLDGNLWVLNDFNSDSPEVAALRELWNTYRDVGSAL